MTQWHMFHERKCALARKNERQKAPTKKEKGGLIWSCDRHNPPSLTGSRCSTRQELSSTIEHGEPTPRISTRHGTNSTRADQSPISRREGLQRTPERFRRCRASGRVVPVVRSDLPILTTSHRAEVRP